MLTVQPLAVTVLSGEASQAQIFASNVPLPTSTYITVGNLDWTWAAPAEWQPLMLPTDRGWRYATELESGWWMLKS